VTVRKYSAWEKYCYVASARRRATVDEKGGGISCRHTHSLFSMLQALLIVYWELT